MKKLLTLLALFCIVCTRAWAQTSYTVSSTPISDASQLTSGIYAMSVCTNAYSGFLYYDTAQAGEPFRVKNGESLTTFSANGVVTSFVYLWKIEKNGDSFSIQNVQNDQYISDQGATNKGRGNVKKVGQVVSGNTAAACTSFTLGDSRTESGITRWLIYKTGDGIVNGSAYPYLHTNGYGNPSTLSYWEGGAITSFSTGSAIKVAFYPVTENKLFKDGKKYILQSNAPTYKYLQFDQTVDVANASKLVSDEANATKFTIAESGAGYTLYADGYYLSSAAALDWNTSLVQSPNANTIWYVKEADSPSGEFAYWITREAITSSTTTTSAIFLGSQSTQDHAYDDQKRSDSGRYLLWKFIEVEDETPATQTYTIHILGLPCIDGIAVRYNGQAKGDGAEVEGTGLTAAAFTNATAVEGYTPSVTVSGTDVNVKYQKNDISFDSTKEYTSGDIRYQRAITAITLGSETKNIAEASPISSGTSFKAYRDLTGTVSFTVSPNEVVSIKMNIGSSDNRSWTGGYIYQGQSQNFEFTGAEEPIVSYIASGAVTDFTNSLGSFTTPSAPGTYRMRLVHGSNSIHNAKGDANNFTTDANAFRIVDFLLVVEGVEVVEMPEDGAGNVLWNDYDSQSHGARIPAIVKTQSGKLLAFADHRPCGKDIGYGEVDIVLRRSTDNGANWGTTQMVANGTGASGQFECGFGDAAVVADNTSNSSQKVLMMCAAGNVTFGNSSDANRIQIARFTSDNDGETWSVATNVTSNVYTSLQAVNASISKAFFSSGKITQSASIKGDGALYNRIYSPVVTNAGTYVMYSDDFGANWSVLGNSVAVSGGDESHVVELPNGDVLISSRNNNRIFNVFSYNNKVSATGTWGTQANSTGITATNCNGDIELLQGYAAGAETPSTIAVVSIPKNGSPRRNVAYYYKDITSPTYGTYWLTSDINSGWTEGLLVSDGTQHGSAYSSLCKEGESAVYMLLEENNNTTTDSNVGYNITFFKHTIDEITGGVFTTERQEASTIHFILTDESGATYEGDVEGVQGVAPTFTGCEGISFENPTWSTVDGKVTYSANVVFPFPVGTPTYITGEPSGIECYWTINGTTGKTYNTLGATNEPGNQEKWEWIIYPSLNNSAFTFKLKNVSTGKYIAASGNSNITGSGISVNADGNGATSYAFTLTNRNNGKGFNSPGTTFFLSCNSSTAGEQALIYYNLSGNSHRGSNLRFHEPADFDALMTELQETITCAGVEGTGVGKYTINSEANRTAAQALINGEQYATAARFTQLIGTTYFDLNLPQSGNFYRLKSHKFGTYLNSSTVNWNGNTNLLGLVNGKTGDNEKTTIMYLTNESHLVTYATGMGLCNCIQIKTADTDPYEGNTVLTFSEDSNNTGCYNIRGVAPGYDRYLYGYEDKLARNGEKTPECVWELEEVTSLPVSIGATKFATFYTPVELQVPAEVTAYVCNLNDENLAMYTCKQTDGEHILIPAGTAVMLNAPEQAAATTYDFTIPAAAQAESYENNSFFGDVATKTFESMGSDTYYSLQRDNANADKVGFFVKPSGNFKGFQAFLSTPASQTPVQRFNVTFDEDAVITGIADVLGTENITIPAFDLSGRKVDASSHRGLYIMNGKTVIR